MSSQARLRDEVSSFFTGKKASLLLACGLSAPASLSRAALAHAQADASDSAPTPAPSSLPTVANDRDYFVLECDGQSQGTRRELFRASQVTRG